MELPVDFESATIDYNVIGFEGAESAVVANPDASGENTSDTVVETTKTEGAAVLCRNCNDFRRSD